MSPVKQCADCPALFTPTGRAAVCPSCARVRSIFGRIAMALARSMG